MSIIQKFRKFFCLNNNLKKLPDASEYSTTASIGSVVPVQIEAYFLALKKYVQENARVLDVGFGLGYGVNILSIKANQVYGVDVDEKALGYCNDMYVGKNPRIEKLSLYDGYNLHFDDNSFDIVTCVDVIEHVEDYRRLIQEMLRVCQTGVFISTPNRRPEFTNPDGTPKNYWHLREWSYAEFNDIIKEFGQVEWNFINGPYEGPFKITDTIQDATHALSPFIKKR